MRDEYISPRVRASGRRLWNAFFPKKYGVESSFENYYSQAKLRYYSARKQYYTTEDSADDFDFNEVFKVKPEVVVKNEDQPEVRSEILFAIV